MTERTATAISPEACVGRDAGGAPPVLGNDFGPDVGRDAPGAPLPGQRKTIL